MAKETKAEKKKEVPKYKTKGVTDEQLKGKILVEFNILTKQYREVEHVTSELNCTYTWMDSVPCPPKPPEKQIKKKEKKDA